MHGKQKNPALQPHRGKNWHSRLIIVVCHIDLNYTQTRIRKLQAAKSKAMSLLT